MTEATIIRSEQNEFGRPLGRSTLNDMLEIVHSRDDRSGAPSGPSGETELRGQEPLWRQVLGDRLRELRHERGERLADIAGRAGISTQYLSEIERGRKEPSSEMIAAISGALGIGLVDLTLSITESLSARERRASRPSGILALAA